MNPQENQNNFENSNQNGSPNNYANQGIPQVQYGVNPQENLQFPQGNVQGVSSNIPQAQQIAQQSLTPQQTGEVTNPYSIEYLNQIAPKAPEPFWTPAKKKIVALVSIALFLIIALFIFTPRTDTPKEKISKIYYSFQEMEKISEKYQKWFKNRDISASNITLKQNVKGSKAKLAEYMKKHNIEILSPGEQKKSNISKNILELYQAVDKRLDNARLNVRLDDVYAREMSFQIKALKIKIEEVEGLVLKSERPQFEEFSKDLGLIAENIESKGAKK